MRMADNEQKQSPGIGVEFLKGCPACEHSDPQLERELHAFAQLLFDIGLSRQNGDEKSERNAGIDKRT